MSFRIGHGYDVHRLIIGRPLIIGGVHIPFEKGLDGHSDADVLLHAISDAVLGALGMGDIGRHFPDTDNAYKNADSLLLLKKCCDMMKEKGYQLGNLDATVVAQQPKMSPYIEEMVEKIAGAFGCDKSRINVKATTEEYMGFTGELLGISAHAVCLLQKT